MSEYDTLKELKAASRSKITEERKQSAKHAFENVLMEKVAASIECDIPDAMIDLQAPQILEELQAALTLSGHPL